MSKSKKRPDLTSLIGGAAKTSGATANNAQAPESKPATEAPKAQSTSPEIEKPEQGRAVVTKQPSETAPKAVKRPSATKTKEPARPKKKKADDYMMTSIAFDADDMLDLQDVAMCFMRESRSLKYPTRNMVAKVGIKAAHILSQEDPERLLELFELIRSKDRRYSENRD